MNRNLLIRCTVAFLLLCSAHLYAQQRTVRGKVVDKKDNLPLPGVSVKVKGDTRGIATSVDGTFVLNLNSGSTVLQFSFVGYQSQEIDIKARDFVSVEMESTNAKLNEVVVVGYGQQAKRYVTGSVAKVDVKQTEDMPVTNFAQNLRGRVPGVTFSDGGRPGQGGTIQVRGVRSPSGNKGPLIILDGVFFYGSLQDINSDDIASLQVLKDQSALAIYGTRAANGAILITTKKGLTDKPTISANAFYGASSWSKRVKLYSPEGYLQRILDYRAANGQTSDPTQIRTYLQTTEQTQYDAGQTVDGWDVISAKNPATAKYNLSMSGKTDRVNYFISGQYADDQGLILNDREKRVVGRANISSNVTNWLNIGINTLFSKRNDSGVRPPIDQGYSLSPYAKLYTDASQTALLPYPSVDQLQFNPLFNPTYSKNDVQSYAFQASMFAVVDFPFVKGLSYRVNYNPNYIWSHNYAFTPNYNANGYVNTGSASKQNQQSSNWQLENILTYNKKINEDHEFDVTLLYGRDNQYNESTTARSSNIFNNSNGWDNLNLGTTQTVASTSQLVTSLSSMARINYHYKNRYFLTLTARHDGNSQFGEGQKFGTFPSAAFAWVASDEPFIKNALPMFDQIKLRTSYGSVGNIASDPYRSLIQLNVTQYVFGDGSQTYNGVAPNPQFLPSPLLGWETTKGYNAAIDFDLLKGRFNGTVEYYNNHTTGLLQLQSVPVLTGFTNQYINIGETNTWGFEFSLNSVNMKSKDFEWDTNFIFSYTGNKWLHIKYQDGNHDGIEDNDIANNWVIGQPIRIAYDYTRDGIYQTGDVLPSGYKPGWIRVKDINNSGSITSDDRSPVGSLDPKYNYGLTNTFRYKNFNFSFMLNAMTGYIAAFNEQDVSNATGQSSFPGRPLNMLDAGYWTPQNQSTTRPGLNFTNPLLIQYYVSRNFLRLQNATLGYTLPKKLTNKMGINSLRVYVSGQNLITWTKWPGPDPESGNAGVTGLYPTARIISGGLNLNF